MDPKGYLTNGSFCPLPWTGFYYQIDGTVKNCTQSTETLGNIKDAPIENVLGSETNCKIRRAMLNNEYPSGCKGCHSLEAGKKSIQGIMSSRLYYLKQLKSVPLGTYDSIDNFDLSHVDLRWQNTCNFACIYCGPEWSSKWERELGLNIEKPPAERYERMKSYVMDNAHKLKNIYLAGGEPMLMTENEQLLSKLKECNPEVELRVNTNLSNTSTGIFRLICSFPNVHWTVSVETMGKEFEYIRYGGVWQDLLNNLQTIRQLPHKITFNMLWFVLNHTSLFDTIDYFMSQGFAANSFALGAIKGPVQLDIRNLPQDTLLSLESLLRERIAMKHGYLLEDGYKVLLDHIKQPFESDLAATKRYISDLDTRRGLDSRQIFKTFYELTERQQHG